MKKLIIFAFVLMVCSIFVSAGNVFYDDFSSSTLDTSKWNIRQDPNPYVVRLPDVYYVDTGLQNYHTKQNTPLEVGIWLEPKYTIISGDIVEYDVDYISGSGNRESRIIINNQPIDEWGILGCSGWATCGLIGYWNGDSMSGNTPGLYHVSVEFFEDYVLVNITNTTGGVWSKPVYNGMNSPYQFAIASRTGDDGVFEFDYDNFVIKRNVETCGTGSTYGMISYWSFDNQTNSGKDDYSDNDCYVNSASWSSSGVANGTLNFDGVNDYAITNPTFAPISAVTVEAWIKTTSSSGYIFSKNAWSKDKGDGWGGTPNSLYGIHLDGSKILFVFEPNHYTTPWYSANYTVSSVNDGKWHHVAGIHNGTNLLLYIDGQLKDSELVPSFYSYSSMDDSLKIGARAWEGLGEYFTGSIDEVAFYGRALTPSEISQHFTDGNESHQGYCKAEPLTKNNYLVYNWNDLQNINNGHLGDNIYLMNDLNSSTTGYSEMLSKDGGKGFNPIGNLSDRFTGNFYGQNHTITGLYINRPEQNLIGLFGFTFGKPQVTIKEIGLIDVNVTGDYDVGALVGRNFEGSISNSYATGTVTGDWNVGLLVGYNTGTNLGPLFNWVIKSYTKGTVNGQQHIGGLIGDNGGVVNDTYFAGTVNGGTYGAGGLLGVNYFFPVTNSYSTGTVNGNSAVGGLIGWSYSFTNGVIINSFSSSSVTGNSLVGGLIGDDNAYISNSYWDIYRTNQIRCTGYGIPPTCFGKNTNGNDPDYFYNITHEPMNHWNFSDVWFELSNSYPILRWQPTQCTPDCTNKDCGNDGCDGSCGTCSEGKICNNDICVDTRNEPVPEITASLIIGIILGASIMFLLMKIKK